MQGWGVGAAVGTGVIVVQILSLVGVGAVDSYSVASHSVSIVQVLSVDVDGSAASYSFVAWQTVCGTHTLSVDAVRGTVSNSVEEHTVVGMAVGAAVGASVGAAVGASVGPAVGAAVGTGVAWQVWPTKSPMQPPTHS